MDLRENTKRGIYLLPNLFTLASLFAGFYAIVAAFDGSYEHSAMAIFIAMVFDGLDGRIARMTSTMTSFGAEFDSLVDMVSFGIAPSVLVFNWALADLEKIGWSVAFFYAAAVALRLARFNTQIGKASKRYFQGLSCTSGAGFTAGLVWFGQEMALPQHSMNLLLALIVGFIGLLMVSNIRYRSFKDLDFKRHVPFIAILLIALIFMLVYLDPARVLFGIFALYVLSGPIGTIWGLHQHRRLRKQFKLKTHHAS